MTIHHYFFTMVCHVPVGSSRLRLLWGCNQLRVRVKSKKTHPLAERFFQLTTGVSSTYLVLVTPRTRSIVKKANRIEYIVMMMWSWLKWASVPSLLRLTWVVRKSRSWSASDRETGSPLQNAERKNWKRSPNWRRG